MGKPNIDVISQTNEVLFAICFHNFASVAVTRKYTNAVQSCHGTITDERFPKITFAMTSPYNHWHLTAAQTCNV